MSWLPIRTLIETWLTAAPHKFYPTVNNEIEPVENLWKTVVYGIGNSDVVSYCRDRIEHNSFTVVVYGNPGLGWNPVIQAAEDVKTYIMAQSDPLGKFDILDYTPPIEFTSGFGVPWYGVEIVYTYQYLP